MFASKKITVRTQDFRRFEIETDCQHVTAMKLDLIVWTALATGVEAGTLVLGSFRVLEPFTSGLAIQPHVWYNSGTDPWPDQGTIMAIGRATTDGDTLGALCEGQDCPLQFSLGSCGARLNGADRTNAFIDAWGTDFSISNLQCVKDISWNDGGNAGDHGFFSSEYRCDLGRSQC